MPRTRTELAAVVAARRVRPDPKIRPAVATARMNPKPTLAAIAAGAKVRWPGSCRAAKPMKCIAIRPQKARVPPAIRRRRLSPARISMTATRMVPVAARKDSRVRAMSYRALWAQCMPCRLAKWVVKTAMPPTRAPSMPVVRRRWPDWVRATAIRWSAVPMPSAQINAAGAIQRQSWCEMSCSIMDASIFPLSDLLQKDVNKGWLTRSGCMASSSQFPCKDGARC